MDDTVEIPANPVTCNNFSGGQWHEPSGAAFEVISPYTNRVIGRARETAAADLNSIVTSAAKAQAEWARTPMKERAQVLFRVRELMLRDLRKLSHRICSECGKTLAEAEAEILKGIEVVEFALSLQNLDSGGKMEVSRGVFCEYRREPLGVVAGITPFNFPAMVPFWMIPIAIAVGNAFIWKPSDKTPLTSLLIAELMDEAGLPPGIFSIAHGGKSTVNSILEHENIKAIGFVGSTSVAAEVYRRGTAKLKRVLALGGAKNHIFLLPDADMGISGKGIADSFTGCAGQRCMAASVLCAIATNTEEEKRVQNLIDAIVDHARKIHLGNHMGAIISKASLERLENAIERATKDGATLVLDGRQPEHPDPYSGGNWLKPTIIDQVRPGSEAAVEELFGPVLSIIRCRSLDEAMQIQRHGIYGNAVSVFTQNGGIAERVAREGKAGMVGINIGVPVPREPFSFGGVAASKFGHGDITGVHSLDFWSDVKKVTTKWATQKDTTWMG